MTIEELDNALRKLGLDIDCQAGKDIRSRILAMHGQGVLESKIQKCANCWLKSNKGICPDSCAYKDMPDDPAKASEAYLSRPNNVDMMPFIFLYVIPVYEETTGQKDTIKHIAEDYRKMQRRKNRQNPRPY